MTLLQAHVDVLLVLFPFETPHFAPFLRSFVFFFITLERRVE